MSHLVLIVIQKIRVKDEDEVQHYKILIRPTIDFFFNKKNNKFSIESCYIFIALTQNKNLKKYDLK